MTERDDQMKEYITWTGWGPRIVSGTVRCVDGLWFGVDKRGPREYVVTELTTGLAAHNASKPFTSTKAAWAYLTPEIVRRVRELISTAIKQGTNYYQKGSTIPKPFHTVHEVLKARILKWSAIPFSTLTCLLRNPVCRSRSNS